MARHKTRIKTKAKLRSITCGMNFEDPEDPEDTTRVAKRKKITMTGKRSEMQLEMETRMKKIEKRMMPVTTRRKVETVFLEKSAWAEK